MPVISQQQVPIVQHGYDPMPSVVPIPLTLQRYTTLLDTEVRPAEQSFSASGY